MEEKERYRTHRAPRMHGYRERLVKVLGCRGEEAGIARVRVSVYRLIAPTGRMEPEGMIIDGGIPSFEVLIQRCQWLVAAGDNSPMPRLGGG